MSLARFRVKEGNRVKLGQWPTQVRALYQSRADYEAKMVAMTGQLSDLQARFYAHNQHALLLVFQAMDAAGKDGVIRHVMSGINPQGCQVYSFKHPSSEELDHDFLWRSQRVLPERGRIGIFNRSYYEEVLIVRVHPQLLAPQGLGEVDPDSQAFWRGRYRSIVDFEQHLHRNSTRIVKFFLHLSKEEQRKRLIARIDDPDKNWKFTPADLEQRRDWDRYMRAYEACLTATSSAHAPWYVVPADDKKNARLIVSQILLATLAGLKPQFPRSASVRKQDLAASRAELEREADRKT